MMMRLTETSWGCLEIWYSLIWSDMVWYGLIWSDMVWYEIEAKLPILTGPTKPSVTPIVPCAVHDAWLTQRDAKVGLAIVVSSRALLPPFSPAWGNRKKQEKSRRTEVHRSSTLQEPRIQYEGQQPKQGKQLQHAPTIDYVTLKRQSWQLTKLLSSWGAQSKLNANWMQTELDCDMLWLCNSVTLWQYKTGIGQAAKQTNFFQLVSTKQRPCLTWILLLSNLPTSSSVQQDKAGLSCFSCLYWFG